ncbi:hypothetical protein AB0K00_00750 [Dactylosporangium sp. NPDC049525]|uniref:hypothetical protein n=1 Tax=Dactylosporangium sp. NPDC049525 TaxID=3154730 RepID=UPI003449156A
MTERDPLRTHFDAFRDQSARTANPPSVEEIPRRLRRTRRRRTVAAVLAAIALIALVTLPSWRNGGPPPIPANSPTATPSPSPSPSTVLAAPPPGGPSSASSAGSSRSAVCGTSARGLPQLPDGRVEAQLSTNNDGLMAPLPRNLFDVCPAARLQFVHVAYGWDIQRAQYVQVYSASYALTRSQPTVAWPAMRTVPNSNFCGEVDIVLATGRSVPTTIPRSVQDSAEPNSAVNVYLQKSALAYGRSIRVYAYNTLMATSACVPSSPPA